MKNEKRKRAGRSLGELGEFGLIAEISRLAGSGRRAVRGIGDDAAVLENPGEDYLLLAADAVEEGVHFLLSQGAKRIGRKALAVNLSDIAAMGGEAQWALVCLGLPPERDPEFVLDLYRGMEELAGAAGVGIVGGDTWRTRGALVLAVTVLGRVSKDRCLFRDRAREGDIVCVTGSLGDAALGKHLDFEPRLAAGRLLAERFGVRAAIDLSDGLFADLQKLCAASGVGAEIRLADIPATARASALPGAAFLEAVGGGEEFELLFTVSAAAAPRLLEEFPPVAGLEVAAIGTILRPEASLTLRGLKGEKLPWPPGYDHFQGQS